MISPLLLGSNSPSLDSTPLKLSQLNRTAFGVIENAALLQAFHSADWATQWAALCFMEHFNVLNAPTGIRQAAQNDPLLAGALEDLPSLNPSCRHVSDVLRSQHVVPDAFGEAFRRALLAALNADADDRLRFCLAVLSMGGLSIEMKEAAFGALYSLPLDEDGQARVAACAPEEGVKKKLLQSFEAAGISYLNLNSLGSDPTPPSEVTPLSISPMSHSGTVWSFGQPHNGQPITPISQAGHNGNSFHISLLAMHDSSIGPSEIIEEEKKSESPRFGPL
ncbi:MAG: hypothetical protein ACT6UH_10225 [Hydrogenophaga sp.]|jgi:hypothetical protein|uniref:hypothetical protein n=1 Tax=Hydrogenophaga sp. TaxID=1904254 RepID=UPI004035F3CE